MSRRTNSHVTRSSRLGIGAELRQQAAPPQSPNTPPSCHKSIRKKKTTRLHHHRRFESPHQSSSSIFSIVSPRWRRRRLRRRRVQFARDRLASLSLCFVVLLKLIAHLARLTPPPPVLLFVFFVSECLLGLFRPLLLVAL